MSAIPMSLVVAMDERGVIGRGAALPWHLPDDLKHFKAITMGKPILMGRRTHESIGRALPGRLNIVLSRAVGQASAGVEWVQNLEAAWRLADGGGELCVIGGAQIYGLTLSHASRIYLTRVHAHVDGDVLFPEFELNGWREVVRQEHAIDPHHRYAMSFITLER